MTYGWHSPWCRIQITLHEFATLRRSHVSPEVSYDCWSAGCYETAQSATKANSEHIAKSIALRNKREIPNRFSHPCNTRTHC